MTATEEIKARLDIVDLISETVKLKRSGKNYIGFCPFHHNVHTPSFVVFPENGRWQCFGQCNEGGDIFNFVMKKEGWDFAETLKVLAERAGVELKPLTAQETEKVEEFDRLRQLLESAVTFYRHQMLNTSPGQQALEYLHKRGLGDQILEAFGVGYAPQSWDATANYLQAQGYSTRELAEAGMVTERESGGFYDRFRHRVMFPIRDGRGRMAGFGARILNPDDVPKFLNSPQTALFDKGNLLYGLDRARKAIRTDDQAVIVEGYLDVIALHQHGFANAVSPMGTALSEAHLRMLKRFTRRIILALDPDAAGDKATLRGLEVARQALDRSTDPVFDARGLLGFAGRLEADIRVTTLPEGLDPDDVVNRDPAEWQRILENASPIVTHVMHALAAQRSLDDPKVKNEIAAQVLPLIEDVPSSVEREAYRHQLAYLLRIDERALLPELGRRAARSAPAGRRRVSPKAGEVKSLLGVDAEKRLESHCLGILLRRPDLLYRINRLLQEDGLGRLAVQDFQLGEHQAILRLLLDSLAQDEAEPLNYVLNSLTPPLMDVAERLLEQTARMDPADERIIKDVARALLDLRKRNIKRMVEHLQFLMEDSQREGDMKASPYGEAMISYTQALQLLDRALKRVSNQLESIK